ncbi:MAG: ABC transporter ATP-binding protein [Prolixibacteraceae bacterium]|jgi:ABC-type Fe3+/spermidine/putrescine transport system ATPase subunit|nr:ABC transporter ATP-binding protein [Prolixibacteraceae bacterium]
MEEKSIIAFQNCTKRFGNKTVLNNISFSLSDGGKFISILGKSGSGKTTLIRLLAGLEKLNSGTLFIHNKMASENGKIIIPPHERDIGFVFQDLALFPHFTVFENIAFGLKVKKVTDYKEIVVAILRQFNIEELTASYPNQLSGGQQQLVALARSLVLQPKILLMDEPLANLDVKLKTQIRSLLKQIISERNITLLYITHDHSEAMEMSDKILFLNEGSIEFLGTPQEMRQSDNPNVQNFIEL